MSPADLHCWLVGCAVRPIFDHFRVMPRTMIMKMMTLMMMMVILMMMTMMMMGLIFIGSASLVQLPQAGRVRASQDPLNSGRIVAQKVFPDRRIFGHLWQDPLSCVTPSSDPSSGRSFHFPDASGGPQEGLKTAPTRPKTPTRRPEDVFLCARCPKTL